MPRSEMPGEVRRKKVQQQLGKQQPLQDASGSSKKRPTAKATEPSSELLPILQPEPDQPEGLEYFIRYCRTQKCMDFQSGHCKLHKPMQCFNFHFEGQRRRSPLGVENRILYWDTPCKWMSHPGKCPHGESCILAHSKGEISYHPAKYKTRMCNGEDCRRDTCCFAHTEQELRPLAAQRYSQLALLGVHDSADVDPEADAQVCPPCNEAEQEEVVAPATRKPEGAEAQGTSAVDLRTFKVFPCRRGRGTLHDRKLCPFFHNPRDRRRLPGTYAAEPCDECFDSIAEMQKGKGSPSTSSCSRGDACDLCHNRLELLYHDSVFKRRFCATFPEVSTCQRGDLCAFAHSRAEVRVELLAPEEEKLVADWTNSYDDQVNAAPPPAIVEFFTRRFKTLWCPYGVQHSWHECLYAHTYQDWRRPGINYGSEPCSEWSKNQGERLRYEQRCLHGFSCTLAHGSKEQLYHPLYYKTMPCTDWATSGTCPRGPQCAFFHSPQEQRHANSASRDLTLQDLAALAQEEKTSASSQPAVRDRPGAVASVHRQLGQELPIHSDPIAAAVAAAWAYQAAAVAARQDNQLQRLRDLSAQLDPDVRVPTSGAFSVQDVELAMQRSAGYPSAARLAMAQMGDTALRNEALRNLASFDECNPGSNALGNHAASAESVATTLGMRSRNSWGSFASLASLASSNSASVGSPPERPSQPNFEPAYVRLGARGGSPNSNASAVQANGILRL